MDIMGLLGDIAILLSCAAFIFGFLITAITASIKAVKYFLLFITVVTTIIAIIILFFVNAFIYLLFQYISVVIILLFVVIIGAACGYGFYILIHRKQPGINMKNENLNDYITLNEFASIEGVDEERALSRIKSRYYEGGRKDGIWFIRRSEISKR